jgi:hypothetical protein
LGRRIADKENIMAELANERTDRENPSELADELAEQDLEQAAGGASGDPGEEWPPTLDHQ